MYIKSASYKPFPKFHFGKDEQVTDNVETVGFELEVCGGFGHNLDADDFTYFVGEIFGDDEDYIYAKSDCSLEQNNGYDGVELVSHPMTYNFIKSEFFSNKLKNLFALIESIGSNDPLDDGDSQNAGLHIHIGLNRFIDKSHVMRFVQIFELFRDLSEYMSQRDSLYFCQFTEIDPHLSDEEFTDEYRRKDFHLRKYVAVNTSHTNTVEVRLFQAPQDYETFMLSLEFVITLIKASEKPDVRSLTIFNIIDTALDFGFDSLARIIEDTSCWKQELY